MSQRCDGPTRYDTLMVLPVASLLQFDLATKRPGGAWATHSGRNQLHAGQRHRIVPFRRGDDGLEAIAVLPNAGLQRFTGEHDAREPGAVAADPCGVAVE